MLRIPDSLNRLAVYLLFSCLLAGPGMAQNFIRVNTGTRADIQQFIPSLEGDCFFLTNKLYKLEGSSWGKIDFPLNAAIYRFFPVSGDDIWFTTNEVIYTSQLFHYHHGIIENIRPPFSNIINSIRFIDKETAFFTSLAEIAFYKKGVFTHLPVSPTRNSIVRICGYHERDFWAMSFEGELYQYSNNHYKQYLKELYVMDICQGPGDEIRILAGNKIFKANATGATQMLQDHRIADASRILWLPSGEMILAGKKGLVMSVIDGVLSVYPALCNENLENIASVNGQEVWISGRNGRLLYRGPGKPEPYEDLSIGFSSHRLVSFNVDANGEYGVAMADFNGDRKKDLYAISIYHTNRLYINQLTGNDRINTESRFMEEAEKRGATGMVGKGSFLSPSELKIGVNAADFDNDGDQDLYLNYLNSTNKLLLNKGDGFFRNVSLQPFRGCDDYQRSNASAAADVDLDGDLDLFVTSENGSNHLLLNDGTAHFTDITQAAGLTSNGGGMCAAFSDINNDGYPDLCVSNWYPGNRLFLNVSKGKDVKFREITAETDLVLTKPAKSNAVLFADFNNDALNDLLIVSRNAVACLYLNQGNGRMKDESHLLPVRLDMANGAVAADFDMDGYLDIYISRVGDNVLLRNNKGKGFNDVTASFGAELSGYGTGCAAGDIDADGDPDIFAANYVNGSSTLLLNISGQKRSVVFRLEGCRSNRDAVGAKIWLFLKSDKTGQADSLCGFREISAGNGYCSSSDKDQIFGIDPRQDYYALIRFPLSLDTLRIDGLKAGKIINVTECNGAEAFFARAEQSFIRLVTDREVRPEIYKYLFVCLLLFIYGLLIPKIQKKSPWPLRLVLCLIFIVFHLVNRAYLFEAYGFRYFLSVIMAVGLMLILHLYLVMVLLKRRSRKEKLELREKLSRDLHDDLASTLGSISIYSESLNQTGMVHGWELQHLSGKISNLTRTALHSISDIIWMTSPRNDTLQSLISKTGNDMMDLLTDAGIQFNPDIQLPDEPVRISENLRNDAHLILKEGLNNILKHAEADKVVLSVHCEKSECCIRLSDNGKGFHPDRIHAAVQGVHGNGLQNMRKRAEESGITFRVESSSAGTSLVMNFKI